MKTPEEFLQKLKQLMLPWTDTFAEVFDQFYLELVEYNTHTNLTRISSKEDVYIKHFLDSLSLMSVDVSLANQRLLDIGSGAGFPGIPLAIMNPTLHVTSVESTGKKVDFQKQLIKRLNVTNVTPIHTRVEELKNEDSFDIIISRAVARLPILVEFAYRLLKTGGSMVFLKGPKLKEELVLSEKTCARLGLELSIYPMNFDETSRFLAVFKKTTHIPLKTRSFGQIKKNPLW